MFRNCIDQRVISLPETMNCMLFAAAYLSTAARLGITSADQCTRFATEGLPYDQPPKVGITIQRQG